MKSLSTLVSMGFFMVLFVSSGCKNAKVSEAPIPSLEVDSVYLWICNMQQSNGLLLSSEGGKYVSLYDNALAALAFSSYGDFNRAEKIFDFYEGRMESEFLIHPGGFGPGASGNRRSPGGGSLIPSSG